MRIAALMFLLGWLLVVLVNPVQAQEKKTQVTVYLKNGKVLQGTIITSIFEEYLTLEIDEVTHLDIRFDRIKSIHFGKLAETKPVETNEASIEKGFVHYADIGLLFGQSHIGSNASLSLNMINGYQFNQYLMAGIGVGLDIYGEISTLPIYASARGLLTNKKVAPYYFFNTGYALAWANNNVSDVNYSKTLGGLMIQPGIGYQFNMAHSALLIGLGYRWQKATFEYTTPGWGGDIFYHEARTLRRLSLSVGISF